MLKLMSATKIEAKNLELFHRYNALRDIENIFKLF
jgi:hypothetical protein